jgi:hypothetical protein
VPTIFYCWCFPLKRNVTCSADNQATLSHPTAPPPIPPGAAQGDRGAAGEKRREGGGRIMFTLSWVCCSGVCCSVRRSALFVAHESTIVHSHTSVSFLLSFSSSPLLLF